MSFGFRPEDWGFVVRILAAALLLGMLLYYLPEREKGIAVSVSTEYLAVDTLGDADIEWEIPLLQACIRTDAPPAGSVDIEGCDPSLYHGVITEYPVLKWPTGYRLEFRGFNVSPGIY